MDEKQPSAVDAEAVTWAYRLLLGREPENAAVIQHHIARNASLYSLRRSFMASPEFKQRLDGSVPIGHFAGGLKRIFDVTPNHAELEERHKAGGSIVFYKGETCNYLPRAADYARPDFLETCLLKGWMPQSRPIQRRTRLTTFGSCFAINIANHLFKVGYDLARNRDAEIYVSSMVEGFVNTYALLQQFEWALENRAPAENLWHGFNAEEVGYGEDVRLRTRAAFLDTEFFIITLGLSEVWFDEVTGGVFWRAVPLKKYDPARHRFRVCSFEETKRNISRIYSIISTHVPEAKVLFTLSPIPLLATFRPAGCLTANSASKAILRAALDEFLRENEADLNRKLFYFPSYEIVQELFPNRFMADCRHPDHPVIDFIMQAFESAYCESGMSFAELNRIFHEKRMANIRSTERP